MTGIFDTHAHFCDERFNEDRHIILPTIHENGIAMIMEVGNDMPANRDGVKLAQQYDFIWCSVGIHPHTAAEMTEQDIEEMAILTKNKKVSAIGEIGLDYHYDFSPRELQKAAFERQLQLAKDLNLPVIIHNREAHEDTMTLLKKYQPKGIVHCYSGSIEMAKQLVDLGLYIGFTGVVTFKNAKKALEVAQNIPLSRLLVETDCPYMAPEPFRGQRCDSSMLVQTIEKIAAIRGLSAQEMANVSLENGCSVFNINS